MKLACTVQVTAGVTVESGRIPPCSTKRLMLGVPGPMSLGVRPTVEERAVPLLEVYILDFDEPIYGRRLHVDFLRKLRDEVRFPDVDAMRRQIDADVKDARAFFAGVLH